MQVALRLLGMRTVVMAPSHEVIAGSSVAASASVSASVSLSASRLASGASLTRRPDSKSTTNTTSSASASGDGDVDIDINIDVDSDEDVGSHRGGAVLKVSITTVMRSKQTTVCTEVQLLGTRTDMR